MPVMPQECNIFLFDVLRDHIINYDQHGRPVLGIFFLDKKQLFQANLQKAMGQIYSHHKYDEPYYWYRNELLLDKMYELMRRICEYKDGSIFRIRYKPFLKFEFYSLSKLCVEINDKYQQEAAIDLINYLIRLRYIIRKDKKHDEYEIGNTLNNVPMSPTCCISKEEKDFLNLYERFLNKVVTCADLYLEYCDRKIDQFKLENFRYQKYEIFDTILKTQIKFYDNNNCDCNNNKFDPIHEMYDDIKNYFIPIDRIEDVKIYSKWLIELINRLENGFLPLLKTILVSNGYEMMIESLTLHQLYKIIGIRQQQQRQHLTDIKENVSSIMITLKSREDINNHLLIIQSVPSNIKKDIEEFAKRNISFVIILLNKSDNTKNYCTERYPAQYLQYSIDKKDPLKYNNHNVLKETNNRLINWTIDYDKNLKTELNKIIDFTITLCNNNIDPINKANNINDPYLI